MPRLGTFSGRDICRILQLHGFEEVRQRGSHVIMQKRIEGPSTITVPVPDHKELRKGTLLSIIRQSQISRNEFER